MIVNPENYAEQFKNAGADNLTVHIETCNHLHRNIQQIKSLGMKAGVAVNPHTPVSGLSDVLHDIDLVCLMSVNPGFGGQKFIPQTLEKIKQLRKIIELTEGSHFGYALQWFTFAVILFVGYPFYLRKQE